MLFPELSDKLKRFDSIVDANNAEDMNAFRKAVKSNHATLEAILSDISKTWERYNGEWLALSLLKTIIDDEAADQEVVREIVNKPMRREVSAGSGHFESRIEAALDEEFSREEFKAAIGNVLTRIHETIQAEGPDDAE